MREVMTVATAVAVTAGCAEATPDYKPTPVIKTIDKPIVAAIGDSIMFTALQDGYELIDKRRADPTINAYLGRTAADSLALLPGVEIEQPDILIVELGTNDAHTSNHKWGPNDQTVGDGWNEKDEDNFKAILEESGASCVAFITPGFSPALLDRPGGNDFSKHIKKAGQFLDSLAAAQPKRVVTVDWQDTIDKQPTVIESDGIHLIRDTSRNSVAASAANALNSALLTAVERCNLTLTR